MEKRAKKRLTAILSPVLAVVLLLSVAAVLWKREIIFHGGKKTGSGDNDKFAIASELLPESVADVNDYSLIGSGRKVLKLAVKGSESSNEETDNNDTGSFRIIFSEAGANKYRFKEGDRLEYDVYTVGNIASSGFVDIDTVTGENLGTTEYGYDSLGIAARSSANLEDNSANKWYHRVINIPNGMLGKTVKSWAFSKENTVRGYESVTYFDNIKIVDKNGKECLSAYSDAILQKTDVVLRNNIEGRSLCIGYLTEEEIIPKGDYLRFMIDSKTLKENEKSYISYIFSRSGRDNYVFKKGDKLIYKIRSTSHYALGGTVNIHLTDNSQLTDYGNIKDINGYGITESVNMSGAEGGEWYYRSIDIPDAMAGKTADYFTLNAMNIMSDYSYEVQLADVKIINGNKTELLVYGGGNAKNGATAMAENASVSVTRNHTSTNIGSPKGDYLHLLYLANNISSSLTSVRFSNEEYTVKPGDCLEYDIHCDNRLTNSGFGVDIKLKSGTDINSSGWLDQNAIPGVIGIENRRLAGGWHHRKLNISGAAGETVTEWNFAGSINIPDELWQSIGRMFEADIDNVRITNNGKTVKEIYKDGAPADNTVVRRQSNMTVNLSSVPLEAPKPIYEAVTTVDGEVFVVAYNVKDFGAKGDGKTDDTNAFQSALYAAEKLGGGTVYAPAGNYKIEGRLYIPGAVTLLGDWHTPGSDGKETLLMAYSGKGDGGDYAFISSAGNSLCSNLSIWYPEQSAENPIEYPFTFNCSGVYNYVPHDLDTNAKGGNLTNITMYNTYRGISLGPLGQQRHVIQNVYMTALRRGLQSVTNWDYVYTTNLQLTPDIWSNCGKEGAPKGETLKKLQNYLVENLEGVALGHIDTFNLYKYKIDYAKKGIYCAGDRTIDPDAQNDMGMFGSFVSLDMDNVNIGIHTERIYHFMAVTDGNIRAVSGKNPVAVLAETEKYVFGTNGSNLSVTDMNLSSSGQILKITNTQAVNMLNCTFENWNTKDYAIETAKGILQLNGCTFKKSGKNINLTSSTAGASINGNTYTGKAQILNEAKNKSTVAINDTAEAKALIKNQPALGNSAEYNFRKKPTAATNKVYVATDYGVKGDGRTDNTKALQTVIDKAAREGGGIVYVPPGEYEIRNQITVRTGVELRGAFNTMHNSASSAATVFRLYYGKNTPNAKGAVMLETKSGINGIDIFYPERVVWDQKEYAYAVQSLGPYAWVMNTTMINAWNGFDFGTYNNTGHYIDGIGGAYYNNMLFVGNSSHGNIQYVHNNHCVWMESGRYGSADDTENGLGDAFIESNYKPWIFGDAKNESTLQTFILWGETMMTFVDQGKGGFSGNMILAGADNATWNMDIHQAENIVMVAPYFWMSDRADGGFIKSRQTNSGVVTVHNLGTGSITYPGTINVEGGTVNMRQFSLDNSAQHINMRVSGGTLRLAGTIYSSHRVIPELDVQISSEAKAVEIVGWMNVDREFTLSDKSGGKFKSVGIVSAITQK